MLALHALLRGWTGGGGGGTCGSCGVCGVVSLLAGGGVGGRRCLVLAGPSATRPGGRGAACESCRFRLRRLGAAVRAGCISAGGIG